MSSLGRPRAPAGRCRGTDACSW